MNLMTDLLERFPASKPALLALSADGERRVWHFGELIARSAGLSGALAARGVGRGDVVMTLVGNRIEWVLTMLACWRMGAIALPCSTQLRRGDLEHRVAATDPAICVGEDELLAELPDGVQRMTLDDVAAALDEDEAQEIPWRRPTSTPRTPRSSSSPRAPPASRAASCTSSATCPARRRRRGTGWAPRTATSSGARRRPGWSKSARNVFLAPWLCGAAALLFEGRFDAAERLELCEREGVDVLCQAPTEYRILAKRGPSFARCPSLRRAVSAGEALDPDVIAHWREHAGIEICDGYGQTETGQSPATSRASRSATGSMGQPLPGFEVRGCDREPGELQVRAASCPTFFGGYLGSDDEPPELVEGEWWPTGDLVRRDDEGYLFYESRSDDLILSSGYRIGPFEVESALLAIPRSPRPPPSRPPTRSGARSCGRSWSCARASPPTSSPASSRSTSSADRALQVPPHHRVRR